MSTAATPPPRRRRVELGTSGPILAFAALIVLFALLTPASFLSTGTLFSIVNNQAVLAILACGLTVVLLAGEFDLSIGFTMTLTGALAAGLVAQTGLSEPVAILAALGVGAAVGLVNGLLVTAFSVPALIATLATGTIVEGLTLWYTGGETIFEGITGAFIDIGRWSFGELQAPAVYLLVIAAALWVFLRFTASGRYLHAIGGNRAAARISGIRVERYITAAFVLSGVCAAVAGVVLSARNGSAQPGSGTPFLLPAFAAAFLGSVTLRRGEFHIIGTVVGVYLIATGSTGFVLLGAPFFTQQLFSGAVLVLATAGSKVLSRRGGGPSRASPTSPLADAAREAGARPGEGPHVTTAAR